MYMENMLKIALPFSYSSFIKVKNRTTGKLLYLLKENDKGCYNLSFHTVLSLLVMLVQGHT